MTFPGDHVKLRSPGVCPKEPAERGLVSFVGDTMPAKPGDPRSTRAWRRLRAQVYAEETHCWRCQTWVNQALPKSHPMSRTVDHIVPIARGGAGVPDRAAVRLAHRRCNARRGDRPDRKALSVDLATI